MTTLYTIGYEGTDIDRFVATLKAVGVYLLADVRALPLSRKKGFSKNGLRVRIEREGMEYVHLGALGALKRVATLRAPGALISFARSTISTSRKPNLKRSSGNWGRWSNSARPV